MIFLKKKTPKEKIDFVLNGQTITKTVRLFKTVEFNEKGWEVHSKIEGELETWSEYDSNGNIISFKNSKGKSEIYEYDSNGNEIHLKNSEGYEEFTEYDNKGNIVHYKNSLLHDEKNEYDYD